MNRNVALAAFILTVTLFSQGSSCYAQRMRGKPPVSPTLEIEILDPGVDPLGNPAVLTKSDGAGNRILDVPPTVLVHRYYYTGDRDFQGPMLPGGPTILVVTHPYTGERLYLDAQMVPGSPRVTYTRNSIDYDYGKQGMKVSFSRCGSPVITYRNCRPLSQKVKCAAEGTKNSIRDCVDRTGIGDLATHAADATKNAACAAADGIKTVGTAVVTPIAQTVQVLPLVKTFSTSAEQRATTARDSSVRRAQSRIDNAEASIRTVR